MSFIWKILQDMLPVLCRRPGHPVTRSARTRARSAQFSLAGFQGVPGPAGSRRVPGLESSPFHEIRSPSQEKKDKELSIVKTMALLEVLVGEFGTGIGCQQREDEGLGSSPGCAFDACLFVALSLCQVILDHGSERAIQAGVLAESHKSGWQTELVGTMVTFLQVACRQ